MKKITVLFGNYGSGKTELALNIALDLCRRHENVTLIDLDIVNPYFRSSEHKKMLEDNGIRVVAPVYANTAVDLPTLPPDIYAAFNGGYAVFDCGGDPVGATALGGLKANFDRMQNDKQALFVVNTKRPFQDSPESIIRSLEQIQTVSRMHADGFVLNSNLGSETSGDELVDGYAIIQEVCKKTGIPLSFVSGTEQSLHVFKERCPGFTGRYFAVDIMMRPYWMD